MSRVQISDRALQIFRFLLGALIAYDLIAHFTDVTLFYSDQGIFQRPAAISTITQAWWSIYFLAGSAFGVLCLYFIHVILALLFMAGVGLPWVSIVLWAFQFSLRNRNISVMDGSDDLSIVLLLFAIFLPLTPRQQSPGSFFQKWVNQPLWHAVFIVQILCLYSFSALQKYDVSWTSTFNAIQLALRLDILVNGVGKWLLNFPTLLKGTTAFVYFLELSGPMIYLAALFFPQRWALRTRQIVCLLFIAFHLGLSLTMRLGVFPYYCIVAWIALFPLVKAPPSEEKKLSAALIPSIIASAVILITILFLNVRTVRRDLDVPVAFQRISQHLSLHQNWGMFAPFPALDNYQIKTYGEFSDGTSREIVNESFWLENRHRVKYWLNMDLKRKDFLTEYALYWCRKDLNLNKVRVVGIHRVAHKEKPELENRYQDDLWIQPCK